MEAQRLRWRAVGTAVRPPHVACRRHPRRIHSVTGGVVVCSSAAIMASFLRCGRSGAAWCWDTVSHPSGYHGSGPLGSGVGSHRTWSGLRWSGGWHHPHRQPCDSRSSAYQQVPQQS